MQCAACKAGWAPSYALFVGEGPITGCQPICTEGNYWLGEGTSCAACSQLADMNAATKYNGKW